MSQNSWELSTRFSHLLQPIRDLTKNWNIDVASALEEYIEEIEQITITFDGGATTMNFAEAALLIQGSTCIYSKKVEYLYALVYQTLDLMSSKRKLAHAFSVDDQGKDKDVSFAQRSDAEEFLSLDDMVEATNIDMDEGRNKGFKNVSIVPRTPMSLIPLQDTERASSTPLLSGTGEVLGSRVDFKMNTSTIHPSGALLLEPVNQFMLSVKMSHSREPIPIHYDTPAEKIKEMLAPDHCNPALQHEDGEPILENEIGGVEYSDDDDDPIGAVDDNDHLNSSNSSNSKRMRERPLRVKLMEEEKTTDPWTLLDPHDKGSAADNKPFRKGTTYKILPSLQTKKSRKRKNDDTRGMPTESLMKFIQRSIYSCSSTFPKNPLKAPLSSEFEGYYWAEVKNRLKQKRRDNMRLIQLRKEHALLLEQQALKEEEAEQDNVEDYHPLGDDYSDHEDEESLLLGDDGGDMDDKFEGAFNNYVATGRDHLTAMVAEARMGTTFQGVEPMALDELSGANRKEKILDYEDLVKNYVESTIEEAHAYIQETEVSKRVQQWENKIKPQLALEESYPLFDIHDYGARVMDEFQHHKQANGDGCVYFRDVVKNKEHYEISRLFTATLQLANDYNMEIAYEGEGEEAVDSMSLTLLNTDLPYKAISSYKAPSLHSGST